MFSITTPHGLPRTSQMINNTTSPSAFLGELQLAMRKKRGDTIGEGDSGTSSASVSPSNSEISTLDDSNRTL